MGNYDVLLNHTKKEYVDFRKKFNADSYIENAAFLNFLLSGHPWYNDVVQMTNTSDDINACYYLPSDCWDIDEVKEAGITPPKHCYMDMTYELHKEYEKDFKILSPLSIGEN